MSDSIGSSVIYPSSLAPYSLLPHQTMPVDSAYTARTQSLVHELREERDQRIMELVGKKKIILLFSILILQRKCLALFHSSRSEAMRASHRF